MQNIFGKILRGLVIAACILGLDQWSKWLAISHLKGQPPFKLFPFLNFVYVKNAGVSFGLLKATTPWMLYGLIALALVIVGVLLKCYLDARRGGTAFGFLMIIAGALGNILDRIRLGGVIDFIDFHWCAWHFPAFNVADAAITLGAFFLICSGLFGRR